MWSSHQYCCSPVSKSPMRLVCVHVRVPVCDLIFHLHTFSRNFNPKWFKAIQFISMCRESTPWAQLSCREAPLWINSLHLTDRQFVHTQITCLCVCVQSPPGLKKNLKRTYESWSSEQISKGGTLARAQSLFCLAWFHAVCQERRNYIPQVHRTHHNTGHVTELHIHNSAESCLKVHSKETVTVKPHTHLYTKMWIFLRWRHTW